MYLSCGILRRPVRKPHSGNNCFLSANAVAVAVTVGCAVVGAAVVVIAAAEPEHEKNDDNPAAVTAIAKVKSTVHKDISFK